MPGQVELYTNHSSLKTIISKLKSLLSMQVCATHLVDCSYLMDVHKYLNTHVHEVLR